MTKTLILSIVCLAMLSCVFAQGLPCEKARKNLIDNGKPNTGNIPLLFYTVYSNVSSLDIDSLLLYTNNGAFKMLKTSLKFCIKRWCCLRWEISHDLNVNKKTRIINHRGLVLNFVTIGRR